MHASSRRLAVISLAIFNLNIGFAAFAESAPPPAATQNQSVAPPGYVTVQQYNELKQEVDELKKEVEANEKHSSATETAAAPAITPVNQTASATPSPAANTTTAPAGSLQAPMTLSLSPGVGQTVQTLFAAKTEKEYFSPFDIMNPGHIRPDMPMQIGQYQDMGLFIGLETVGRFQDLQDHNVYAPNAKGKEVEAGGLDAGFQTPFANLSFLASIPNKMDVYFDTYIASRAHPSTMYGHEGYLLFKALPGPFDDNKLFTELFDNINVKVGAFDIDFGDQNYRRSNNAFTQRNPLIGNAIVDPNVEEIGGEIYNTSGPLYWLVGVGSGTTTEHFDRGSEPSVHAKLWAYPLPEVRTSISAYHVDLSNSGDQSYLYAASRSGGTYGGVFEGGDAPGQILPQAGKDVTAVQGDVTWNHWPFEVYGNAGYYQDGDTNGSLAGAPGEQWIYGQVEGVYHITPAIYVAGRYSVASASEIAGISSSGMANRFQIGGGYWITNNLLAKAEYVYENFQGFSAANGVVSGVNAFRNPVFNGVLVEVSFGF